MSYFSYNLRYLHVNSTMKEKIFLLFVLFCAVQAAEEGDSCIKNGVQARCVNIKSCPAAIEDIKNKRNPLICGFSGMDPIVCCASSSSGQGQGTQTPRPRPGGATTARPRPTTTEYVPPVYDYKDTSGNDVATCPPLPLNRTAARTGQKAWDKCIEYQETYVYPCRPSVGLALDLTVSRENRCGHKPADDLILGGEDAGRREFPHMALLGFGDTPQTVQFLCGGSVISEKFIVTAGHCTYSRDLGEVTYAVVGALRRTEQIDATKLYKIKTIHQHPDYKSPSKYNDIALLETEVPIKLSSDVVPICLHVGDQVKDQKAIVSGWGVTAYKGSDANNLQKVTLQKFTTEECSRHFPPNRLMKQGILERTQMCYGDRNESKDTCQGDSGGPIQIKSSKMECMYVIIGVTSFGKACGVIGQPGVYTRVAPYVPWIESVVWP